MNSENSTHGKSLSFKNDLVYINSGEVPLKTTSQRDNLCFWSLITNIEFGVLFENSRKLSENYTTRWVLLMSS